MVGKNCTVRNPPFCVDDEGSRTLLGVERRSGEHNINDMCTNGVRRCVAGRAQRAMEREGSMGAMATGTQELSISEVILTITLNQGGKGCGGFY